MGLRICRVEDCKEIAMNNRAVCGGCRGKAPARTVKERFQSKVNKTESCHLWVAYISPNGYGSFLNKGKSAQAHRVAWELYSGKPIPVGLCVLHRCDVRNCVNPEHLFLGTIGENNQDRHAKGRTKKTFNKGELHCNSKLTSKNVTEIKESLSADEHESSICVKYNVCRQTILAIKNNKTWKHIK